MEETLSLGPRKLMPSCTPSHRIVIRRYSKWDIGHLFSGEHYPLQILRGSGRLVSRSWDQRERNNERAKDNKNGPRTGLDEISTRIVSLSIGWMKRSLATCFNEYLRTGRFPNNWKLAKLVLLKKLSKDSLAFSYRRIYLLNEMGKLEDLGKDLLSSCSCWPGSFWSSVWL